MNLKKKITDKLVGNPLYDKYRLIRKLLEKKGVEDKRLIDLNKNFNSQSHSKSALIWTTHKCASTLISKIFLEISKIHSYKYYNYESRLLRLVETKKLIINDVENFKYRNFQFLFRNFNEIYGPLRSPILIDNLNFYKNIFILRDPRDVLISYYFWITAGRKHLSLDKNQKEKFIKLRSHMLKIGINEFCLEFSKSWIIPTYTKYYDFYKNSEYKILIPYSKIINDYDDFIKQLFNYLDIKQNIPKKILDFNKYYKNGYKNDHLRDGSEGQFKFYLNDETNKILNKNLIDIFNKWKCFEL